MSSEWFVEITSLSLFTKVKSKYLTLLRVAIQIGSGTLSNEYWCVLIAFSGCPSSMALMDVPCLIKLIAGALFGRLSI